MSRELWCKRFQEPVEYSQALHWQRVLWQYVIEEKVAGVMLLLEHEPVFTLGRSAAREHLLVGEEFLRKKGIEVYEVERGGEITYHGPGQIVGYPIVNLRFWQKDVHAFLRHLEEGLIRFLHNFRVDAFRLPPHTGVWVHHGHPQKIAALGIAVRRWVTYHGFALNITPDLAHFSYIIPCGIRDKGVTSLSLMTGVSYDQEERYLMQEHLAGIMGEVFGFTVRELSGDDFTLILERGFDHERASFLD